ncbi:MAG: hypothetical protein M1821_001996 [Bathelium mastoideum]|nr:MAG: hypothetical protein M1821_001996 [Bathelium mastoideum]
MSDQLYETLKQTAIAHIQGYESPSRFNNKAIQKYRTPEYVHCLHPKESIPPPFDEPIKLEQFAGIMHFFDGCLDRFHSEVEDIVVDARERTMVARMSSVLDLKALENEPKEEGYTAEYMLLMQVEESGKKIVRVEEFLDSQRLMGCVQPKAGWYAQHVSGET